MALAPTNVSEIIMDKINSISLELEDLKNKSTDIDMQINDSFKAKNIITIQSLWENFNKCKSIEEQQRIFKIMLDKILWFPKPNSRKGGAIEIIF